MESLLVPLRILKFSLQALLLIFELDDLIGTHQQLFLVLLEICIQRLNLVLVNLDLSLLRLQVFIFSLEILDHYLLLFFVHIQGTNLAFQLAYLVFPLSLKLAAVLDFLIQVRHLGLQLADTLNFLLELGDLSLQGGGLVLLIV